MAGLAARCSPACQNRFKQPGRGPDKLQCLQNGPCSMRAASNSQGRGPKNPAVCHYRGGGLPGSHAASNSQRWGPKYPAVHTFLGALAVALRVVFPLFRFRPPLPCPWTAALLRSGGVWLLTWLLAPAGKCGCPALPCACTTHRLSHSALRVIVAVPWCFVAATNQLLLAWCKLTAAFGQRSTDAGILEASCRLGACL